MRYSPVAKGGTLRRRDPKLVLIDFGRGWSLDYETEWCQAGTIEVFEKFKMAAKMAAGEGDVEIAISGLIF